MEALELTDVSQWDEAPPSALEEREIGNLAFELWRRASRQDFVMDEDSDTEDGVACHASCL